MKKIILTLITLTTINTFAGGYLFNCSNADGSVKITSDGDTVEIYGKKYTSRINLKGVEIWAGLEDTAQAEVIGKGKRTVLYQVSNTQCRETGSLAFSQKIHIRNQKTKELLAENFMICENSYATTSGGADCGPAGEK